MAVYRDYYLLVIVLCSWTWSEVTSSCSVQPPQNVLVKETDGPGHVIFSINTPSTTKWAFTVSEPVSIRTELTSYFSLTSTTTSTIFTINKTLDLEAIYEKWGEQLVLVTFYFTCTEHGTPVGGLLERFVTVTPVNEFYPEFINAPFTINVTENTALNTMVFKLKDYAQDRDVNPNQEEIYGFNINPYYNPDLDGRFHFSLTQTQTGDLSVSRELDFESMSTKYYLLNVSVEDVGKRTSFTVMRVNIVDQDDQGPEFYTSDCTPGLCHIRYTASVGTTFTGAITTVNPERVAARDKDTLNALISYSITSSNAPAYFSYFTINNITGTVSVIQPIGKALFVTLAIEATEVTLLRHAEMTSLTVTFRDPTTPCSYMARSA